MYLIGLTGGIASGKSVVASRLAEHGAVHIDADALAREVVEPGQPALAEIEKHFGSDMIGADGHLDRAALASVIFADPERRAVLNAITHPAVKERARELMDAAAAENPHAVIVYDVPLLIEARVDAEHEFDLIVVVNANTQTRLARLTELRGLSRAEAVHRLNSQVSDTERLAIADVVIDNNGSLEETFRQADALWESVSRAA
ncbi:MAG: dephospho-CoA kinase, long form [Cryobacterium sp.]|nr:dephospho-CoA kinase, long form [Cryobacterium sp.]